MKKPAKMSPITLQQELNLSRRACWSAAAVSNKGVATNSKCYRVSGSKCVLLVLLGVLLCSFPAPTCGRPNGTATAVKESQPNVSICRLDARTPRVVSINRAN